MSDTTKEPEDKLARARASAMATYAAIVEMVDKLRMADDDDLYRDGAEELAKAAGFTVLPNEHDGYSWAKGDGSAVDGSSYADTEDAWFACCEDNRLRPDADEARREIEEDALSVQVRSGWYSPGEEKPEAEEYELLLSTGGPAVRIVGELDRGEPSSARLECQDWFTAWEQVFGVEQDTLLAYARCTVARPRAVQQRRGVY